MKRDLRNLNKDRLISLLVALSRLNKENAAFLKGRLSSDYNELFKVSCKRIDNAFSCFEMMSLKDARKTLIDFKKATPDNSLFIELCLYHIKSAYDLEKTDWRFQENFYSSVEKVYDLIFDILKKDSTLREKYRDKVKGLIRQSNEGWGHRDYLEDEFEDIK